MNRSNKKFRAEKKPALLTGSGIIPVAAVLMLLPGSSQAAAGKQTDSAPPVLAEVVVTATRTEKDAAAAPGSFSVIRKQELESRNIKSLDEALNSSAGVSGSKKAIASDSLSGAFFSLARCR